MSEYKIYDVCASIETWALSRLKPNSKEIMLNDHAVASQYKDLVSRMKKLKPDELQRLIRNCSGNAVSISIDLPTLDAKITELANSVKRNNEQMAQAKWLIQHRASNQQILSLCSLISSEDIRELRETLGVPILKGRLPMPSLEDRLSVIALWKTLTEPSYQRYVKLHEQFPQLSLGQLHTIVTDANLGMGSKK